MNKSYSKIRHINNVNLILENRYLNEQLLDRPKDTKESDAFFKWVKEKYPKLVKFFFENYQGEDDVDEFRAALWNYEIGRNGQQKKLGVWFREENPTDFRLVVGLIPYDVLDRTLAKAKEWWLKWLGSENTIAKFKKINKLDNLQVIPIWVNYIQIINSAKYYVVSLNEFEKLEEKESVKNADAWVNEGSTTINVPIWAIMKHKNNEEYLISTFIHEIQHLMYYFYPMNPIKGSNFSFSDGCFEANKKIYDNTKLNYWDRIGAIVGNKKDSIAKDLGISADKVVKFIDYLVTFAYNSGWEKDYLYQDNSEFLSRLSETREYFKIPFGGDIEKKQIVNYINTDYSNKRNGSVNYVLARWVVNNFPPLDNWIKELNSFAERNEPKQKPSPTDVPYQPKTRNV